MREWFLMFVAVCWTVAVTSCTLAPAASVVEGPEGQKAIVLDAKEVAVCEAGGGCVLLPKDVLDKVIKSARGTCI